MAAPFQPLKIIETLNRHGVEYVIIGGIAGTLHGSDAITNDFDIAYRRTRQNEKKLLAALNELRARLRNFPSGLPFVLDEQTLKSGDAFTFETTAGNFDCFANPIGTTGYADLMRQAETFDIEGMKVQVASLDDLIRMKKASGRPKDLYLVEILEALRRLKKTQRL